jgi:hypothetical protein
VRGTRNEVGKRADEVNIDAPAPIIISDSSRKISSVNERNSIETASIVHRQRISRFI